MNQRHSTYVGTLVAYLAWTAAAVLACGVTESNDPQTGEDNTWPEFDAWLRQLPVTLCERSCPDKASLEVHYGADCLETVTLQFESYGAGLRRVLESGNVSFDAVEAQRCIDEWLASECGYKTQFHVVIDCNDQVLVGKLPLDAPCRSSFECAGDAYCHADTECSGRCTARLGEGAACNHWQDGCQHGLACSSMRVCAAPAALGAPCRSSRECQSELCWEDRCAEQLGYLAQEVDEPCYINGDCKLGLVCQGETCQPANQIGERCQPYDDQCIPELACFESEDADGVCVERIALGGACNTNLACTTSLCVEGVCEKRVGLGEPCVTDDQCWGAFCQTGVCDLLPGSCL